MKISNFDRKNIKELVSDMDKALLVVAEKYGISIQIGNGSFTANNVSFKLQTAINSNGVALTRDASSFEFYANSLGQLKGFSLGEKINIQGKQYVITGWKPKTKNPVIVTKDCKTYRVSAEMVKMYNPK